MSGQLIPECVYVPSDDVVARGIEGEITIVPLVAGIGDADDELHTVNETLHEPWSRLDGQLTPGDVAVALRSGFNAPLAVIQSAVLGFAMETAIRRILAFKE